MKGRRGSGRGGGKKKAGGKGELRHIREGRVGVEERKERGRKGELAMFHI